MTTIKTMLRTRRLHRERRSSERKPGFSTADRRLLLMVFGFFAGGLRIGALAPKHGGTAFQSYVSYLVRMQVETSAGRSFAAVTMACAAPYAALLLALSLFSCCAVGIPVLLGVVAFSGLCTGTVTTYLYSCLGTSGLLYNLLLIIPASAIVTVSMLGLCVNGVHLSAALFMTVFQGARRDFKPMISQLAGSILRMTLAIFAAALIQSILLRSFGKYIFN